MSSLQKGVKQNQFVTASSINNNITAGPNMAATYQTQSSGISHLERKKLVKNIRIEGDEESEEEKLSSGSDDIDESDPEEDHKVDN